MLHWFKRLFTQDVRSQEHAFQRHAEFDKDKPFVSAVFNWYDNQDAAALDRAAALLHAAEQRHGIEFHWDCVCVDAGFIKPRQGRGPTGQQLLDILIDPAKFDEHFDRATDATWEDDVYPYLYPFLNETELILEGNSNSNFLMLRTRVGLLIECSARRWAEEMYDWAVSSHWHDDLIEGYVDFYSSCENWIKDYESWQVAIQSVIRRKCEVFLPE